MGKSLKGKELGIGITQRKDGLYQGNFTDVFGKRHFVYGKTIREVTQKLNDKRHKEAIGTSTDCDNYSLNEWFDYWLKTYKTKCRNTSIAAYSIIYNNCIKEQLGSIKLSKLTPIIIQTALDKIEKKTMKVKAREVLCDMFSWAVKIKLIRENAAENVYVDTSKPPKTKRFLEDYEVDLIKKYGAKRCFYNFFIIGLNTGMRGGEIIALKWKNVDLDNNIIHVRETFVDKYYDGKSIREDHPTKTTDGVRDIPMTKELKELLTSLKSNNNIRPDDNVLKTRNGTILSLCNIDNSFKSIVNLINKKESCSMEYFSSHAIRRTFATNAVKNGMNPKVLQYIMGHSSFQMTMDLYCQLSIDTIKSEMECMDVVKTL